MVNARGYLFIFLNAVRVLSIISLLLLFSSSIVSMVQDIRAVNAFIAAGKSDPADTGNFNVSASPVSDDDYIDDSTVPNQPAGAFWAVLNWLLIIVQCLILVLSEVSLPFADRFFARFFPVLGPDFGLGALGVIQCLLGAAVLSHHVHEFTLVAAFLLFSVGCLNIALGLVFREKAKARRDVREWRDSERDVLPVVERGVRGVALDPSAFAAPPNVFSGSGKGGAYGYGYSDEKGAVGAFRSASQKSGMGFGRQGEKFAANQGYVVREPEEAVPPYAAKPAPSFRSGKSHASHVSVSSASSYPDHDRDGEEREEGEYDEEEEEGANPVTRTNSSATAVDRDH